VGVPNIEIAINAFLGNPILFYGHEKVFHTGINAFDPLADDVNRTEPQTQWCSLGCVAQHLYLVRTTGEHRYDVMMLSNSVTLDNPTDAEVTYEVEKPESFVPPVARVEVQSNAVEFYRKGGMIQFQLAAPPHSTKSVHIRYANAWNVTSTDTSQKGLRISVLRHASDFRDIELSRYWWGERFIRFYYDRGLNTVEAKLERELAAAAIVILVLGTFLFVIKRAYSQRRRVSGDPRSLRADSPRDLAGK
jgi:hypothetical protein